MNTQKGTYILFENNSTWSIDIYEYKFNVLITSKRESEAASTSVSQNGSLHFFLQRNWIWHGQNPMHHAHVVILYFAEVFHLSDGTC